MRGTASDTGFRQSSKKWSQREVEQLLSAINAVRCSSDAKDINWAYIAIHVPTRTGKQCREKYKNDLRPDLSKSPWTGQEEYILARAHCEIGNLWAEIGQFLPGRSENTIKNKWNATLRAKADTKAHTLLWTYAQTWQAQDKNTSLEVFEMAVREFCKQNGQASYDNVKVPDSYFQGAGHSSSASEAASQGGAQPHKSGRGHNGRQPARKAQPPQGSRKRSRSTYDSEEEDEQAEEEWSDSEGDGARAAAKRLRNKRTGTSVIQQQLRRQRQRQQQQQQQQQQEELERLELSRLPPPACMPPNFPLPTILPIQAPPQPPPPPSNSMIPTLAQQQQQQQQKPAEHPPPAPALADITNLAHLSNMEPSATIKLCAPKHTQESLKGFSFISDAAPQTATCQASQAGGMGIQGRGELGQQLQGQDVQGSMGLLLQQQLQQQGTAVHTRTPGCKLGHAAAAQQLGSPTPGLGRAGLNPASYLSPAMPQVGADVDYLAYLREIGLESTNEYNHSPATLPLLKLLGSARRDSGYDLGSGFGGSTVKRLPLFGNASRRDSLLLAGGSARRDSWLISGGGRKESLGATGPGHPSNRPSWLSKPSGPQPSDFLSDPPATQPLDLQSGPPQPSDLLCFPLTTQLRQELISVSHAQLTPQQHEQQNQDPQEQQGQVQPLLGVPDAQQLLTELSLRPLQQQQLPERSPHEPPQQHLLPEFSLHAPCGKHHVTTQPNLPQHLGVSNSPTCGFISNCFL